MGAESHVSARRAWLASLSGFGFLAGLVLLVVHRSSPFVFGYGLASWEPFVLGVFGGLLLGGAALALYYAKDTFEEESSDIPAKRLRFAASYIALLCVLVGLLGVVGSFAPFGAMLGNVLPRVLFGLSTGVGLAWLLVLWGRRYAGLSLRDTFIATGMSLVVAAVLSAIGVVAPPEAALVLAVGEAVVATMLLQMRRGASSAQEASRGEPDALGDEPLSGDEPFRTRVLGVVSLSWKPVVGALICVFIFGFTWNTDLLGVPINEGIMLAAEKVAGFAVAGLVILALTRFARKRDMQAVLFNIVLPLLLIAFIVRPYFFTIAIDPTALAAIGFARETGFALFLAAAWIALVSCARFCKVAPGFSLGAFVATAGLMGLAGVQGLYVLGGVSGFVGAVLFVLYLVIVVIVSTVRGRGRVSARDVRVIEQQGFERFVELRCDELADQYGLTPRERDIIVQLGRGHSYAYIANELVVSENTVRTHVRNMYRKMGVSSREDLLALIHGA